MTRITIGQTSAGAPITFTDTTGATGRSRAGQVIVDAIANTPAHEARHAAVGLLFDFRPTEARADLPDDKTLGHVHFDVTDETWTPLRLAEHAVMTIAGHVGEPDASPLRWPPRTDQHATSDEKTLAATVTRLKLNERQYHGLVDVARTVLADPRIKRATGTIAALLEHNVALDGRMLADAYAYAVKGDEPRTSRAAAEPDAHAGWVKEHRDAMLAYLNATSRQDLRRRAQDAAREAGHTPPPNPKT